MTVQILITGLVILIYDSLNIKLQPYFTILYVLVFGIYLDNHPETEHFEWIVFMLFATFILAILTLIKQSGVQIEWFKMTRNIQVKDKPSTKKEDVQNPTGFTK